LTNTCINKKSINKKNQDLLNCDAQRPTSSAAMQSMGIHVQRPVGIRGEGTALHMHYG
jgi:hypothetical protein